MSTSLVSYRKVWIVGSGPFKVFYTLDLAKEFVSLCGDNRQIVEAELLTPTERIVQSHAVGTYCLTGFTSMSELGRLALDTSRSRGYW